MDIDSKVILIQKLARGFLSRKKYKYKGSKQLKIQNNKINLGSCLLEYDPFGLILEIEYTKVRQKMYLEVFRILVKPVLEPDVEFFIALNDELTEKDFEGKENVTDENLEQFNESNPESCAEDTWVVEAQVKEVVNIEICTKLQFVNSDCKDELFEHESPSNPRSEQVKLSKRAKSSSFSVEINEQAEIETITEKLEKTEENSDEKLSNLNGTLIGSRQKSGASQLKGKNFSDHLVQSGLVIEKMNESTISNNKNTIKLPSLSNVEPNKLEILNLRHSPEAFLPSPTLKKISSQVLPELNNSGRYTKKQIKDETLEDTQKLPKLKSLSSIPHTIQKQVSDKTLKKHCKNFSQSKLSKNGKSIDYLNSTSNLKLSSFPNTKYENKKFSKTFVNYESIARVETVNYNFLNETTDKFSHLEATNKLNCTNIDFFPHNIENFASENKFTEPKKRFSNLSSNPSFVLENIQKFRTQAINKDEISPYKSSINPIPPPISMPKLKMKKFHRRKIKNLLKKK